MSQLPHIVTSFLLLNCYCKLSENKVNIQGDVVVAGLFGIYEPNNKDCSANVDVNSVMIVEAVKWYTEKLNDVGKLPFRIGFEAFETCSLDDKAAEHAVTILNRALSNETILGVLGPETSSEAETISHILGSVPQQRQLLQVGFSTTATDLGNDEKYPNFVRVVPNDDIQVEMMVKSMVKLDWNRIAVVYESNVYGQDGYIRLKTRTEQEGICIALTRIVTINNGINANEISQILEDIIIGVPHSRPPINGIVLIASALVAKSIMLSLDKSKYSTIPIIMFSDGSGLDGNVFKRFSGDFISKSKGSLVLAPPYIQITEFTKHWISIFKNATKFSHESTSNPWLLDVFYKVTNCWTKTCNFHVLTDEEIGKDFSQQPLYVSYAVAAQHAMVKAAVNLRKSYCAINSSACTGFASNFHQGNMINAVKGISIDFQSDFAWGPASLRSGKARFTIDQSGEVSQEDRVLTYELYNINAPRNYDSGGLNFQRIGALANNEVTIEYDNIRDYTASGEDLRWPNVRKAQCFPGKICSECIPLTKLQEDVLYMAGDIYVVGVVPIFLNSGEQDCGAISDYSGYQLAASIGFAIDKVNDKSGEYSNFFPGMKIGLIIINSCFSPAVAQRKIYNLHKHGIIMDNGTLVDVKDKIIGYVAEYTSTVSISVASVLSILKFVQISYASTSPALSDRASFPYFMRVVTPDDAHAQALIEIVRKLNANYIQIVYSAGAYGEHGRDEIKESAATNKVCVVQDISVTDEDSSFQIYDKLRKYAEAKVIIIFLYKIHLQKIVSALTTQMKRGEFIFIGSAAWARNGDVLVEDTSQILLGSLTVSLEMYKDRELRNHVQNIKPKPYRTDPWAMLFIQAKRNCYYDLSFDKTQVETCSPANDHSRDPDFSLDTYDTQAYVATKCLLFGANTFLKTKCGTASTSSLCRDFIDDTEGLVKEISKIKMDLDGSGSKMEVFNSNGDGNIGYRIYNIQKDDVDMSKLTYKEVGRYPLQGTFTFEKDKIVYPNDVPTHSRCPNEQACSSCYAKSVNNDMNASGAPQKDSEISTSVGAAFGTALGIAVVVSVVLAFMLYRERRKIQVNSLWYRTKVAYAHGEVTMKREEATPSKIYMEIPATRERHYVPTNN